jgi:hypothetical protein
MFKNILHSRRQQRNSTIRMDFSMDAKVGPRPAELRSPQNCVKASSLGYQRGIFLILV